MRAWFPLLVLSVLAAQPAVRAGGGQSTPGTRLVTPAGDDGVNFPNPERGFYHQQAPMWRDSVVTPLNATQLAAYRAEGVTVLRAYYVIDEFRDAPLPPSTLTAIAADFASVRQAGIKIIPRFAYNFPLSDVEMQSMPDAPLSRVLEHINQLGVLLQANADVIAFMELGFVGAWGEWHHSSNALVNTDQTVNAASMAIVNALLGALPAARSVALRYPFLKQQLFGAAPLTRAEGFSGIPKSRVGAHNDCVLADAIDAGTYSVQNFVPAVEALKSYLHDDNQYVPQGGETCSVDSGAQPYIHCQNALVDLARMHWSTINTDYHPDVIALWQSEGCYPEIQRRLGYRLQIESVELPAAVRERHALTGRMHITNSGFAAPYNRRDVEVVLRNAASGVTQRLSVNADPRSWAPGSTPVDFSLTLPPEVTAGAYEMMLNLPDPYPALRNRPEYSIRLANAGTWDAATGFNDLFAMVTVTPPAPFTDPVLTSGITAVRAIHITELRARIDAIRINLGLSPFTWTDANLTGRRVSTVHVNELRAALAAAYQRAGKSPPAYSDANLTAGVTPVRAVHIAELRSAVVAME